MPEAAVHVGSGKVRELYALDDERLLLVASDRISTFDVILPTEIPDKGRVLTGLSAFWFARDRARSSRTTCSRCATTAARSSAGGSRCCRSRCVVRGYLAGSGWKDYARPARSAGTRCPPGSSSRTGCPSRSSRRRRRRRPATTRTSTRATAAELVGAERYAEVEAVALALYRFAAAHAEARGIILADTKFELGLDRRGRSSSATRR